MTVARVVPFRIAMTQPIVTAKGAIDHREGVLVSLSDGEYMGWGEAAPLPGWPGGGLADVTAALGTWAAVMNGGEGDLSGLRDLPIARAAIDTARADLRARAAGQPLAAALSPAAGGTVAVNALVDATSPDALERSVQAAAETGIGTFKVKVAAQPVDSEIERVEQLRALVGPNAAIRLDANGGWSSADAAAALRPMADANIEFVEEPTADPAEWAALRANTGVAIAADESLAAGPGGVEALLELVDVAVVKVPLLGGVEPTHLLARRIIASGKRVVVTSFHDTAVGLHAALHVAAALGPDALACGLATSSRLATDVGPIPPMRAGRMVVPPGAGLGIEPDLTALSFS